MTHPPAFTAAELFAVVERLPKKWWPDRVHYLGPDDGFSICSTDPDPECGIDDAHAYLIFVGHLWPLAMAEGATFRITTGGAWHIEGMIDRCFWDHTTTTPLHAMVAYFAAKESDHG